MLKPIQDHDIPQQIARTAPNVQIDELNLFKHFLLYTNSQIYI